MPSASSNSIGFSIPVQRGLPLPFSPPAVQQPQSPFDEILRPAKTFPSSGRCFADAEQGFPTTPANDVADDSLRSDRTATTVPVGDQQEEELPTARSADEERAAPSAPSDEPATDEDSPPDASAESVLAAASVVTPVAIIDIDDADSSVLPTEASADGVSASVPDVATALIDDQALSATSSRLAVDNQEIAGVPPSDEPYEIAVADVNSSGAELDSVETTHSAAAEFVEPDFSDPDSESKEKRHSPDQTHRPTDIAHASPVDSPATSNAPPAAAGASFSDRTGNVSQFGQSSSAPLLAAGISPEAQRIRLPAEVVATDSHSRSAAAGAVDSARLLHRVARAFAAAADRGGEVTLRLSPPELGLLKIEVQVHGSALVARIEAETLDARTAILDNLPALRERLTEQGVRIERFDVDLMNRQPGGAPQQPFDDQREARRAWQPVSPPAHDEKTSLPRIAPPLTAKPGGLNVIV